MSRQLWEGAETKFSNWMKYYSNDLLDLDLATWRILIWELYLRRKIIIHWDVLPATNKSARVKFRYFPNRICIFSPDAKQATKSQFIVISVSAVPRFSETSILPGNSGKLRWCSLASYKCLINCTIVPHFRMFQKSFRQGVQSQCRAVLAERCNPRLYGAVPQPPLTRAYMQCELQVQDIPLHIWPVLLLL